MGFSADDALIQEALICSMPFVFDAIRQKLIYIYILLAYIGS